MNSLDLHFDDARLSLAQRVRRWQDAVGDHLVEVDMRPPAEAPRDEAFTGSMRLRPLNEDTIALVDASYQSLARTPERIRRAERETALLTLVVSGECRIAQNGRSAVLKPGDLCIYESVRPYRIDVAARVKALVVATDRPRLEAMLGDLRLYTATPLSSDCPVGSLAARFWRDLAERLPMLDNVAAGRLAHAGLDIVAAGLGAMPGIGVGGVNSALTLQRTQKRDRDKFSSPRLVHRRGRQPCRRVAASIAGVVSAERVDHKRLYPHHTPQRSAQEARRSRVCMHFRCSNRRKRRLCRSRLFQPGLSSRLRRQPPGRARREAIKVRPGPSGPALDRGALFPGQCGAARRTLVT